MCGVTAFLPVAVFTIFVVLVRLLLLFFLDLRVVPPESLLALLLV